MVLPSELRRPCDANCIELHRIVLNCIELHQIAVCSCFFKCDSLMSGSFADATDSFMFFNRYQPYVHICSACAGGLLVAGFVRSSRRDTPPTTMFFKRKYGGPIKQDGRGTVVQTVAAARVTCMCSIHWMSSPTTLRRTSMQSMVHNIMVSRLLLFVGG